MSQSNNTDIRETPADGVDIIDIDSVLARKLARETGEDTRYVLTQEDGHWTLTDVPPSDEDGVEQRPSRDVASISEERLRKTGWQSGNGWGTDMAYQDIERRCEEAGIDFETV